MEYRRLGRSGLFVSAMTLGTMTFGGRGGFGMVGSTDVAAATRQVDMCLDAGINLFDTADIYSDGESEEILGQAISGRRDRLLLATKARMPVGDGPNEAGLSRQHLIQQCEASLGAWERTTSTSTRRTSGTGLLLWRRPWRRSIRSSVRARYATSAAPTTPAGNS